jgi:hypothetical protein
MSWGAAGLLLAGCVAFGALLGTAPARIRTWLLVVGAVLAAALAFMPGTCVTAMASVPYGDPELLDGITSCDTLYGARLPDLGPLDGAGTGNLLLLVAATGAVLALLLVRRRRSVDGAEG